MLDNKNKALFGGFTRLSNFPLDSSSVFETRQKAEDYLKYDRTAYPGQTIYIAEEECVYVVHKNNKHGEEHALIIEYIATASQINEINNSIDVINTSIDNIEGDIKVLEETQLTKEYMDTVIQEKLEVVKEEIRQEILGSEEDADEEVNTLTEVITVLEQVNKETEILREQTATLETRVNEIIGPGVSESLDTIKEIAKWLDENRELVESFQDSIESIQKDLEAKIDEHIASVNEALAGYATKEELEATIAELDKTVASIAGLTKNEYEILLAPAESVIDYRDKEIRIFCKSNATWEGQAIREGGWSGYDSTKYYVALKAYAPDGATFYTKNLDKVSGTNFCRFGEDATSGIDDFGRKFFVVYLAVAEKSGGKWVYKGDVSEVNKFFGWYFSVEWYDSGKRIIGKDLIRVNLANNRCYSEIIDAPIIEKLEEYVKKDEIEEKIAEIDRRLSDVEHLIVLPFTANYSRSNIEVPAGSIVKSVEVEFLTKGTSVGLKSHDRFVSLQSGQDFEILVSDYDIGIDEEMGDELPPMCEESPLVMIFDGLNHRVQENSKILVESENIKNIEGNVYLRYLKSN